MKKILLTLCAFVCWSGIGFAQIHQPNARTINVETGGYVVTDSIGYTNLSETSDSVWIIDMGFAKGWISLFVTGNANSPVDSVRIRAGSRTYDTSGDSSGVTWGSWVALKDSAWGDLNVMVNNSVGKDFLIFRPVTQLLEFTLMNNRANLVTRNCQITINAVK